LTAVRRVAFSAGGHLAGLAALARGADLGDAVDFAVLGYAITSMETETYRPARVILLGDDATPELRRATSLDALVTGSSPPLARGSGDAAAWTSLAPSWIAEQSRGRPIPTLGKDTS
jgi:hypothetical protein